jgi:hypothetical protein
MWAMSVVTHDLNLTPDAIHGQLAQHDEIRHMTVEINQCS